MVCVCVTIAHARTMKLLVPRVPILATVAQEQLEASSVTVPSQCPVRELNVCHFTKYISSLDIDSPLCTLRYAFMFLPPLLGVLPSFPPCLSTQ